jgi:hypothetical protein
VHPGVCRAALGMLLMAAPKLLLAAFDIAAAA